MMMRSKSSDIVILGGGIVGLTLANQILSKEVTRNITIIDKEKELGQHTSGRNSGVLHAGIYYKPNSLKAKVCIKGAQRLKRWIVERGLPLNRCGKIIVPTKEYLDEQLDILLKRGQENGAVVELWNETKLADVAPEVRSATGRALWSPNTAVMNPLMVIKKLQEELTSKGVKICLGDKIVNIEPKYRKIKLNSGKEVFYKHLFNCAGLHADQVAHKYGVGRCYCLMPFKGLYWDLRAKSGLNLKQNIYPVPDLSVPFLGVHFTPSASEQATIRIGPTATPALGRENYKSIMGIEPKMALSNTIELARQYIQDKNNFRKYVHEQSYLNLTPFLIRAAQELVPKIKIQDIKISSKVAIRAQLFDHQKKELVEDFLCLPGESSTHVLNAISPAFTASFELADMILDRSGIVEQI